MKAGMPWCAMNQPCARPIGGAEGEHADHDRDPGPARREQDRADGVDQRDLAADREVDAGGDDHEGHGDGDDEDGGGLADDVEQVAGGQEVLAADGEDHEAGDEEGEDRQDLGVLGDDVEPDAAQPAFGIQSVGSFADDEFDEILEVGLADGALGDLGALVHHRDAVADAEQVLEAVGDEDDRDAARLDAVDQARGPPRPRRRRAPRWARP